MRSSTQYYSLSVKLHSTTTDAQSAYAKNRDHAVQCHPTDFINGETVPAISMTALRPSAHLVDHGQDLPLDGATVLSGVFARTHDAHHLES